MNENPNPEGPKGSERKIGKPFYSDSFSTCPGPAALVKPQLMRSIQRPNILFLMSDEHRPDVTGYEGNPVVRTPTLDWLGETGTVFRNAYTPSPICIPCRQAMAAGQLPRTCGVEKYGQDLPPFSMTFARRLSEFGYKTNCCGKLHHMGTDQMQGWMARPAGDLSVAPPFVPECDTTAWQEIAAKKLAGTAKWPQSKEVVRSATGESPHLRCDALAQTAAFQSIDHHFADIHYDRNSAHQPLLLKLSLNQPHYPYFTSEERLRYYYNRVTPFENEQVFDHPFLSRFPVAVGRDVTETENRRATAAYYGMIESVDSMYGEILDRLRLVGQDLDDWIILYCSDHGEMLGQHGVWEKQKFFEASARVPLIIRWPRQFTPSVVHENVNLCDLFATLCDLTDVPLPHPERTVNGVGLDSRSLVPLMRGEANDWSDETISQFGGTNLLIKRGSLKYQWYEGEDCAAQPEVLFDLEADPTERENLIDQPHYTAAVTSFRQRRGELNFGPTADPQYRNAGYEKEKPQTLA